MNLRNAAALLILSMVLHNGDHARRGLTATSEAVVWVGTFGLVVVAIAVTLVFTRHPMGPPTAAAVGLALAFGVSAVHLLPSWGPMSDSLPSGKLDAFTWIAVCSEIVAAAWFGWVGLRIFQRNGFLVIDQNQDSSAAVA